VSNTPRTLAIDPARTANLADGWRAVVAVDQDGHETYWLASPTPQHLAGCACRSCAPHDQLDSATTPRRSPA
jgi:hypothetical protein